MPELPEVETIARALRQGGRGGPALPGRVVSGIELAWDRTLAEPPVAEFAVRLVGQQVEAVDRRGKFIIIRLTEDALLVHLRMSGDLRVEPGMGEDSLPLPPGPYDRLAIYFEDGTRLAFSDARKFGRAWLVSDPVYVLGGLGPEPFDPELTPARFHQMLHSRKRLIKPLLLDQTFLAGLGNIYTDEALHLAKLHPTRLSHRLTEEESTRLLDAIHAVLEEGIRRNGASFDWVYRGGEFQNNFRVYQRTGSPCPTCGHPVERTVIGQRGTHYCPICQPREV